MNLTPSIEAFRSRSGAKRTTVFYPGSKKIRIRRCTSNAVFNGFLTGYNKNGKNGPFCLAVVRLAPGAFVMNRDWITFGASRSEDGVRRQCPFWLMVVHLDPLPFVLNRDSITLRPGCSKNGMLCLYQKMEKIAHFAWWWFVLPHCHS